jgi:hypothetical protein
MSCRVAIHYIYGATQSQLNQNNSFSTFMQHHYIYTHDVNMTSLIIIHLLKIDTWHYDDFT